jgi:hypothetical protein
MNKQKIIQAIEDHKGEFGYWKGSYFNVDHDKACTMGLLWMAAVLKQDFDIVDVSGITIMKEFGLTFTERNWISRQNDLYCNDFDCVIEAIKNYEQKK